MKPAEEYILQQPEDLQAVLLHLCAVIEQVIPKAELLFKWKLPFYYFKKKPLCYLNIVKKENAVDLCFFRGNELILHRELMIVGNRKKITSFRYNNLEMIDSKVLKTVLSEAVSLY